MATGIERYSGLKSWHWLIIFYGRAKSYGSMRRHEFLKCFLRGLGVEQVPTHFGGLSFTSNLKEDSEISQPSHALYRDRDVTI